MFGMTQRWRHCGFKWQSASWVFLGGAIAFLGDCASAQITPDGTLPNNSIVTPSGNTSVISGGTQAGSNLFHSFEEFSVPTGGAAFFNNALDIQNIISRVTGESISKIDGLLGANGTANLFLLNPNGIIFGPNASLNIGGSILVSTASSLNFADGTQFSATTPQTTPLLTISVPIGLQYGGNAGRIGVQGNGQGIRTTPDLIDNTVGLRVKPNQTLAMVGGNVALLGGTLKTAGGRIELGSVAGPGLVNLTPTNTGWALGYSGVPTFGDIQLSGQATVDASGASGGDIQVQGRRVTLTNGSQMEASTLGAEPGGTLNVTAKESVEAIGTTADGQFSTGLFATVYSGATGAGGNLTVETGRLILRDGAQVSTGTFGTGAGGTLSVIASDAIEVIGTSADGQFGSGLGVQTQGGGDAGDLTIATGRLLVKGGAQVSASTSGTGAGGTLSVIASDAIEVIGTSADGQFGSGLYAQTEGDSDAGDLTITTGRLLVKGGAQVSTGTRGTRAGGTLSVIASDAIEVIGESADGQFGSGLYTQTQGDGDAGDLTITTGRLLVKGGAEVSTGTLGTGAGGTLSVRASDAIEVIGTSADGQFGSGLYAQTEGDSDAGDLTITTGRLLVKGGAQVSTGTRSTRAGGTLSVIASDAIEVIGTSADGQFSSSLFVDTEGDGDAGDLTIATGRLLVKGGAQVSAGTSDTGAGGTLSVIASDAIEVIGTSADGRVGSGLFVQTEGDGVAGDLTITTGRLLVKGGAQVSASTFGTGAGGTLSVIASDAIEVIGESADGQVGSGLYAQTEGDSDAGDLTIATGRLLVKGGAQVSTGTSDTGAGGTLSVIASDAIEVIGRSADGRFGSGLYTQTEGDGDAGDLTITTGRLLGKGGARVSASTLDTGDGGTLSVIASDAIEVIGRSADGQFGSGLTALTNGAGNASDLTIATGQLIVRDGAYVTVSSTGSGNAGNLEVAARSIRLSNQAFLSSDTKAGQGNIILDSQDLVLRRSSDITTNAQGTATGGNITIDTDILAALENSDISANAQDARGGQVRISAQGIFGTEFRERENPATSDITATSELGSEFSGTVEINTPDVDPSSGLVNLPVVPVNTEVAQGCTGGSSLARSEFIITGRGGLPPNPGDALNTDAVQVDLITLEREHSSIRASGVEEAGEASGAGEEIKSEIVEATGWVKDVNGNVVLKADASTLTPHSSWQKTADCRTRNQQPGR